MKRKLGAVLLVVALVLTFGLVPAASVGASPDWYDSDWGKRRPVTIDNTGNANDLTDYQVKVDVAYDSDMQPDFDDLRFTDSDGITELNYWIEEKTDSSSAIVWVKVPSILGSSTKTIYMYYGNPAASSASNGTAVFEIFDDFEDGIYTDKWTLLGGTATETGGILKLIPPWGGNTYILSNVNLPKNIRIDVDAKVYADRPHGACGLFLFSHITSGNNINVAYYIYNPWGNYAHLRQIINGAIAWEVRTTFIPDRNWRHITLIDYDTIKSWFTGLTSSPIHLHTRIDQPILENTPMLLNAHKAEVHYDNLRVRKYTDPEPTTSVGIEVEMVEIDIKPGSDPNSINLKSKGLIPVAILTTPDFDATTVDWTTVKFEGAIPAHDLSDPLVLADHQYDVDEDGDVDFVFHFKTQDTGITPGQTSATLTGYTYGGMGIEGMDAVRTVGK